MVMDDYSDSEYRPRSFEEHFRPDARSDYSDLIHKEKPVVKEEKKDEKTPKGKNIVELLTGGEEIGEFARKLNLDPEMAEKMLVPLLSLLDKYGVGETLTASPKVESATNAFEVIRDVAPVIKGAAEFISGRRAELESTDLAFLEQIKEAQGVADASLFDDEDDELFTVGEPVEEVIEEISEPQPEPLDLNSFNAKDWGTFFATEGAMVPQEKKYDIVNNDLTAALDAQHDAVQAWAKQEGVAVRQQVNKAKGLGGNLDLNVRTDYQNMEIGGGDAGVAHTFTEVQGMNENAFAIVDVSDLASHQGLSMNEIMEGDSQRKINNQINEEWSAEPIDVAEFIEDEPIHYEEMEVPESLEDYDPLHIQDFDIPTFDIEEIEEMEKLQAEENHARDDSTEE
jgi:hypothetical protein